MENNENDIDQINQKSPNSQDPPELERRREVLSKLGKYAAYAAPFTLLANKGKAASQGGGGHGGRH